MSSRDGRRDLRRGALLLAIGFWLLAGTLAGPQLAPGRSWPLLLVLIGGALALTPSHRHGRRPGVLLIAWGTLAWVAEHRLWGLEWRSVGPLILVTIGVLLVWTSILDQRDRPRRFLHGEGDE